MRRASVVVAQTRWNQANGVWSGRCRTRTADGPSYGDRFTIQLPSPMAGSGLGQRPVGALVEPEGPGDGRMGAADVGRDAQPIGGVGAVRLGRGVDHLDHDQWLGSWPVETPQPAVGVLADQAAAGVAQVPVQA